MDATVAGTAFVLTVLVTEVTLFVASDDAVTALRGLAAIVFAHPAGLGRTAAGAAFYAVADLTAYGHAVAADGGEGTVFVFPAFFDLAAAGAAVAVVGVAVVTDFVSCDDAIAACCGDAGAAKAHPAVFELALGITAGDGLLSGVALFCAGDDTISACFCLAAVGVTGPTVFDFAATRATITGFGVAIVALFDTCDDAISAAVGCTSVLATHPTVLELTIGGTPEVLSVLVFAEVALFIGAALSVSTDIVGVAAFWRLIAGQFGFDLAVVVTAITVKAVAVIALFTWAEEAVSARDGKAGKVAVDILAIPSGVEEAFCIAGLFIAGHRVIAFFAGLDGAVSAAAR